MTLGNVRPHWNHGEQEEPSQNVFISGEGSLFGQLIRFCLVSHDMSNMYEHAENGLIDIHRQGRGQ